MNVSFVLLLAAIIGTHQVRGQECCEKKEVAGMSAELDGQYTYMKDEVLANINSTNKDLCADSCVYSRNGNKNELYCFEKVAPKPAGNVSCEANNSPVERMIIEEDGEIIEQSQEVDPETGDVSVKVDAHGARSDLEVVLNPDSDVMTVITGDTCQIKKVPKSVEVEAAEGNVNGTTNDGETVTKEMEETEYSLTIELGQSDQAEIDKMPQSGKTACEGKAVKQTEEKPVDKNQFETISNGGVLEIGGNTRRKRQASCTLKRMCTSRGTGCWRWPYGTAFSIHSLTADVLCVDCCSSGTSADYCSCSAITSKATLEQCVKAENGTCPSGFYKCGNDCLLITRSKMTRCGDTCPAGMKACGPDCLPSWMQRNYRECGDQCISNWEACNGTCPSGRTVCGDRCIYNWSYQNYYTICNGKCQRKSEVCAGQCPTGTKKCGNRCIQDRYFSNYRICNDQCLYKSQPCNGTCATGYTFCNNYCVADSSFNNYYWSCGANTCQRKGVPCNGTCPTGYTVCGTRCVADATYKRFYWDCNGQCVSNSQQCNGTCPADSYLCGNRCMKNTYQQYYRDCSGTCLYYTQPCNGQCAANTTQCGTSGIIRCLTPNDISKWKDCRGQCVWYTTPCEDSTTPSPSTTSTPEGIVTTDIIFDRDEILS